MPILDYSGDSVGIFVLTKNINSVLAAVEKTALTFLIIGFFALVIIQLSVYLLFDRLIDRPVQKLIHLLASASRGDFTQLADMRSVVAVNCSEKMQCGEKDCSMYGREGYCWEEAGSAASQVQCSKILSGQYQSCTECKHVFRAAVQDELSLYQYVERIISGDHMAEIVFITRALF